MYLNVDLRRHNFQTWLFLYALTRKLCHDVLETQLSYKAQIPLKNWKDLRTVSVMSSLISPFTLRPELTNHISISARLHSDESCDWSAFPAGNERASPRGLFKQQLIWLQSCSRTAFLVTSQPGLLTQPTWVIVPYQVPHVGGVLRMQVCVWAKKFAYACLYCCYLYDAEKYF